MKNKKAILRIAQIWSVLLIVVVLIFAISDLIEGGFNNAFSNNEELLSFIIFPVLTLLGLVIALKFNMLGGIISSLSILLFFILRPDLIDNYIFLFVIATPGVLFIVYSILNKTSKTDN